MAQTEISGAQEDIFALTDLEQEGDLYTSTSVDPRMELDLAAVSPTGVPAYVRRVTVRVTFLNMDPGELSVFYKPRADMKEYDATYRVWAHKEAEDGVYTFTLPLLDKRGRVQDVVFAGGLDIDTHKKACAPVVIMAGGLGTRLYPYTKILPKPLIPIGEMPIVEHIIHRFADVGCSAFTMIVNYKKSMIKSYFNDLQKDYTVDYVDEDTPLGTGGGLSLLKGKVTQTFFLTNCDILIDADFGDIYQYHKEKGNVITMVCAVKHFTIPYGVVELGGDGDISGITEKPEMNVLTNTGVYVVEPSVIDGLAYNEPIPFTDIIADVRAAGGRVGVYPVSENSWMDMGQLEELDNMRRRLEMQ